MTTGREIHLASRPVGMPVEDNFRTVEVEVAEPAQGQVKVRNLVMSVDPYMRGRMNDVKSYVPPFRLDAVLDGGAVGEVVESRSPDLAPGDRVLHNLGWRDYAVADARQFRKVDAGVPAGAHLNALGMIGLTAYAGLLDVAEFREGDTVFVSGAAGAVGSLVGQIARLKGAKRVIGSAGSAEKVAYLTGKLGFDAAFNYRDGDVRGQLKAAAPEGVDVYFDNVGGDHLEAAMLSANLHARMAICGMISGYNGEGITGPASFALMIGKRITMRGFLVNDHASRMPDVLREVGGWLAEGALVADETIVDGLERAPEAFIGLLNGLNTGKMLVTIS